MNNETDNRDGYLYITGTRGYSAYEVAVQNGYSGSEEEWLESLIGPQGPQGIDGKSAYEVAVENGYSGTVEDWLNDFLTPDGYIAKRDIIDNLTTDDNKKVLSAKQGKALKDDLDSKTANLNTNLSKEQEYRENAVENLQTQISGLASGSPTAVDNISDMTDTSKIYVLTTDGYWYYYNSTTEQWTKGDEYQSADLGDAAKEQLNNIENKISYDDTRNNIFYGFNKIPFEKEYGYYINSQTGEKIAGADYYSTDYIDVSNIRKIYVSATGGGSNGSYTGVAGYDSNKEFVVALMNENLALGVSGSRHTYSNREVVIPSNVKYIRGCTVYKPAHSYPYSELVLLTEGINEKKKNDMFTYDYDYLVPEINYGEQYIDSTDGSVKTRETAATKKCFISDFIEVVQGDKIYITGIFKEPIGCVCAYDSEYGFLGVICDAYDGFNPINRAIFKKNIIYEVPDNVKYIRGSSYDTPLIIKKIKGNIVNREYISLDLVPSYYVNTKNGNLVESSDYYSTEYIDVLPGETYYFTGVIGGANYSDYTGIAGYDKEGNYVTYILDKRKITPGALAGGRYYLENYKFQIPENVYKIKACSSVHQGQKGDYLFPDSDLYLAKEIEYKVEEKENLDNLIALSEYNTYSSGNAESSTGYKKLFTVGVTSDIHGDYTQWELYKNTINNKKKYVDCALFTGDIVKTDPSDDLTFYNPSEFEVPLLYAIGNHDAADHSGISLSQEDIFNKYIEPLVDANYITTDKSYYYKDFITYKIRVIVLHEYEGSEESTSGTTAHYRRYMTSDQLQWFADTLYNTPTDYSVVVLTHQIVHTSPVIVDCKFTGNKRYRLINDAFTRGWGYQLNNMQGNPIGDIVQSFIDSTQINNTYTNSAGKADSIVSKDFSNREKGKFICYISGHHHFPYVLRDGTYNNQIQIIIPSGSNSYYQRKADDIRPVDDVLNSYYISFDTQHKLIKLLKEGNQTTMDMVKRDILAIPYE